MSLSAVFSGREQRLPLDPGRLLRARGLPFQEVRTNGAN